ncbi:hypothetical protein ACFU6I_39055 [Streptomyces sp. NPDC057486]|uniref:hypothetical protein n=1 Tax=Streptomyces sp. NPDC057486 TaxID=3346145 RepID=UPI003680AD99
MDALPAGFSLSPEGHRTENTQRCPGWKRTQAADRIVELVVLLVDACGVNEDGASMLRELQSLDPAVRADVLRVLDCVIQNLPAHWQRRKGVPQLMVFLDGPKDVRMEKITLRELSGHGYLDEFARRAGSVPVSKAREHGCAALVHGNRIHARINQIGPAGSGRHRPDTFVCVRTVHRDLRMSPSFSLTFDVEGRLFPRLVFHQRVFGTIARARQS